MLALTPQMRILVAVEPADFRCGIDGLSAVCRAKLAEDPLSGTVFVFRSRRGQAIKILAYDGQGFWLCMKRLSIGRFKHWPRSASPDQMAISLLARELLVLIWNGNSQAQAMATDWKKVEQAGTRALDPG
jgi:transposase